MPEKVGARPGQGEVAFQRALYEDKNPTRRGLHLKRRDWVLSRALKLSSSGDKVLEVGVGCGVFTEALSAANRQVDAVDINPAFLDNVEKLPHVEVYLRDATSPLNLGEHDVAICSEVLEHVPSQRSQAMLDSIYEALRPGGSLILTTPQRYSTVELMAGLFRFPLVLAIARKIYGSAEELGHINLLTANEARDQIERAGFSVAEQYRFGFYLPVLAEFTGGFGASVLRSLENVLRPIPILRGLLWTQGWILTKPA